ncbi:MAG: hypothetical protein JRN39_00565 [Nitrososphaerota archaeon]|nr:hypothetical protein [Nitrososphaerota archaeon]
MSRLFGTSGIRGLINRNLTPEFSSAMGLAYAALLGNEGLVVAGMDLRPQSRPVFDSAVSGLVAGGVDVLDAGAVPTPALLHLLRGSRAKGGLMVTGSHTLPPITGLLFFMGDAGESDQRMERSLERLHSSSGLRRSPFNRLGKRERADALAPYLEEMRRVDVGDVSGFRVAFDAGNGSMAGVAKEVLEPRGVKVTALNDVPDGSFPNRSPYPRRETLGRLSKTVRAGRMDFGVGTDGDGDRAIFCTAGGKVLWGDVTGALLADHELRGRRGSVVAPVNSSRLIEHVCRKRGARLVTTRVGPPAIAAALRENPDAVFGFEETGKCIWPGFLLYGDSAYSTLKAMAMLRSAGSMERLLEGLPALYMEKRMIRCPEGEKGRVLKAASAAVGREFPDASIVTLDGVKAEMGDGSWLLLRPSGTEPYFRCYAEAGSRGKAESLARKGAAMLLASLSRGG